ncbi:putative WD repeat-containing protein C32H8.09 [Lasiodiplodia hormozganensis]|uniref:WD repeat-containing protein C32H8.09 n=1 Tax=Lasiodiplodia hormozganensis TaxID=869390 RepID=A0AA40D2S3_9PEZI|nr:putative WD repeat-containing protein C32H8.09 [Lasiodiplodia hormozganensis]
MDPPQVSQQAKASLHPVASPDGAFVAAVAGNRLQIRAASSLSIIRNIPLSTEYSAKNPPIVRWPQRSSNQSLRVLFADERTVRVWDIADTRWKAVIDNGSGGMGKISNVEFGCSQNEVLVFSDFGARVTVWCLKTGRSVEIKDPKYYRDSRGFGYRPRNSVFALLSRPGPQDVLTLHAPGTYFLLETIALPSSDAQGIQWSPDGRWLVVWDAASTGFKLFVYTADGQLYRTYSGDDDDGIRGLGIKSIEWSPRGDYLAVGGYNQRVTLLSTRTFSPAVFLDHTSVVQLSTGEVWQELVSSTRAYALVPQPVSPPVAQPAQTEIASKTGISILAFNTSGDLLATRDDSMPTCVWLWDLTGLTARTVLIQHAPVKSLDWHPSIPTLLLIQCAQDDAVIHLWDLEKEGARVVHMPFQRSAGKLEGRWLRDGADKQPSLIFGDLHGFVTVWPEGKDAVLKSNHSNSRPGTPGSTDESEDSLYNILTGRTPIPALEESTSYENSADSTVLEDTFHGKRHLMEPLRDSECF